jgi:hypothetical protein
MGIYPIYWMISTTLELRRLGTNAPHPAILILIIIPFVNLLAILYYYYKYSRALSRASWNAIPWWLLFIFWIILPPVAVMLSQVELNKLG